MTDYGYLQDHAEAVLELLRTDDAYSPDLVLFEAVNGGPNTVPNGATPPFVTAHFAAQREILTQLHVPSKRMVMRIYLHCVGMTDASARDVSDRCAAKIVGIKPDVDGRSCFPIRQEVSLSTESDTATWTYVTITDTYRLESLPGVGGS